MKILSWFASDLAKISGDPPPDDYRRDNIAGSHCIKKISFSEIMSKKSPSFLRGPRVPIILLAFPLWTVIESAWMMWLVTFLFPVFSLIFVLKWVIFLSKKTYPPWLNCLSGGTLLAHKFGLIHVFSSKNGHIREGVFFFRTIMQLKITRELNFLSYAGQSTW